MMLEIRETETDVYKVYETTDAVYEELFKICIQEYGVTVYEVTFTDGVKHYTHLMTTSLSDYQKVESELHLSLLSELDIQQTRELTEHILLEATENYSEWKLSSGTDGSVAGSLHTTIKSSDQ